MGEEMTREELWAEIDEILLARLMEYERLADTPGTPTQIVNDCLYQAEHIREMRRALKAALLGEEGE